MKSPRESLIEEVVERLITWKNLFPGVTGDETEIIINIREVGRKFGRFGNLWYGNLSELGYTRLENEIEKRLKARKKKEPKKVDSGQEKETDDRVEKTNHVFVKVGRWPIRIKRK